jgi:hypothetical protein
MAPGIGSIKGKANERAGRDNDCLAGGVSGMMTTLLLSSGNGELGFGWLHTVGACSNIWATFTVGKIRLLRTEWVHIMEEKN